MAQLHEVGQPENDGEREVLRLLRDGLPAAWQVVSNFHIEWRSGRYYECDAAVFSPNGKGFLIETKAWQGAIRGNDRQWELPSLVGGPPTYRPNPVVLTQRKAQVLRDLVRRTAPTLGSVSIVPLVVLVSQDPPALDGAFASQVVLARDVADALLSAEAATRPSSVPEDAASRLGALLTQDSAVIQPPNEVAGWRLVELVESHPGWDVWRVQPTLPTFTREARLKRYYLDPLLPESQRQTQAQRAVRDLEVLGRLWESGAQVPQLLGAQEVESGLVVVTAWPDGESLASILATGPVEPEHAAQLLHEIAAAMAGIHSSGIVHRALSPSCIHVARDGAVVVSDFDFARLPGNHGAVTEALEQFESEYVAPEVRSDPASADARSDVWSLAKISSHVFGEPGAEPTEWSGVLAAASSQDPATRPKDAAALIALMDARPTLTEFTGFSPNDELDDRFIVQGHPSKTGGLSVVLKVFDALTDEVLAAKFSRPEYRDVVEPNKEYQLLRELSDHPNVIRPIEVFALRQVKRGRAVFERRDTFTVTRWVDGVRLDELIPENLPPVRALEIVAEGARGLAHLHDGGLLHRDVKPENILIEDGHVRLFDFNVSGTIASVGGTTVGTENYRPPDVQLRGWDASADLYGLALVATELLRGARLTADQARDWLTEGHNLPPAVGDVLRKGLAREQAERFGDAIEFSRALDVARVGLMASGGTSRPLPAVPPEELARTNWNPYQYRLLSFFSQSSTSNARTRGLDEFSEWFYVPTALDTKLSEDLLARRLGLVIITGNAGDGKTAFIQRFEAHLSSLGGSVSREGNNGARIVHDGHTYITNWDGSQDEGETANDAVLAALMAPFVGATPQPTPGQTRILAINEGRLIDFLELNRAHYSGLADSVDRLLRGDQSPLDWLGLVNLNLRTLAADSADIVPELLERISAEAVWEPCNGCDAFDACYARLNAASLRDPKSADRLKQRFRRVLGVASLRRRLHVTMRDLRSALAFAVAGTQTCDEIVSGVKAGDQVALLTGSLQNALFAAGYASAHPDESRAAQDRLLSLIGTIDVGRAPQPELDARLWTDDVRTMFASAEMPPVVLNSLEEWRERARNGLGGTASSRPFRELHALMRRFFFFSREDPQWVDMFPYQALGTFRSMIEDPSKAVSAVAEGISRSEGMYTRTDYPAISVRLVSDLEGSDRTFVRYSLDEFIMSVVSPAAGLDYIEFEPDRVRLAHVDRPDVFLDVDLDLLETLERIRTGFRPSRDELRGAWLNMRVFKEALGGMAAGELLLSRGEREYFRIHRVRDGVAVEAVAT